MRRLLTSLFILTAAVVMVWRTLAMDSPTASASPTFAAPPAQEPQPIVEDRVAAARARCGKEIKELCTQAGLPYPPRRLFLRAFKHEGEVEAWGSRDNASAMKRIATFSVTAKSGQPGPKRREGDFQVPEGCYRVVVFNPKSSFHLSLGLDYPNDADRVHSDPERPGFDIYIHGGAQSIGCLPIGDEMIEELYLLAADVHSAHKTEIPVHIFPMRMQGQDWDDFRTQHPEQQAFWAELAPIYLAFETTHRVPSVNVSKDGKYEVGR